MAVMLPYVCFDVKYPASYKSEQFPSSNQLMKCLIYGILRPVLGRSTAGPPPMWPVWSVYAGVLTPAPVHGLYVPLRNNITHASLWSGMPRLSYHQNLNEMKNAGPYNPRAVSRLDRHKQEEEEGKE